MVNTSTKYNQSITDKISPKAELEYISATTLNEIEIAFLQFNAKKIVLAIIQIDTEKFDFLKITDFFVAKNIPFFIITDLEHSFSLETCRPSHMVDCVSKIMSHRPGFLAEVVYRFFFNYEYQSLVLSKNTEATLFFERMLSNCGFHLLHNQNADQITDVITKHPNIKVIVVDKEVQGLDGTEIVRNIRHKCNNHNLIIFGFSAGNERGNYGKFLLAGANDFINFPLYGEDFCYRIILNMKRIETIESVKETANIDYLTQLYNRRFFYLMGEKIYASAVRGQISLTMAMIDIDHFKMINDTYGHVNGDRALQAISKKLHEFFRKTDLVARYGGEEFIILMPNMNIKNLPEFFDRLRIEIMNLNFQVDNKNVPLTVSIGICGELEGSFQEMIKKADSLMYVAKESGRNRVEIHPALCQLKD
jgi:diguanylate cyclase (GGDEF)-like protein